jgi:hypothetical protein
LALLGMIDAATRLHTYDWIIALKRRLGGEGQAVWRILSD